MKIDLSLKKVKSPQHHNVRRGFKQLIKVAGIEQKEITIMLALSRPRIDCVLGRLVYVKTQ